MRAVSSGEMSSPNDPSTVGPPSAGGSPSSEPDTALPSVLARILAFASVLIGGLAGGLIGYAFGDLGKFSAFATGVLTLFGALSFAAGVAVVAVLTLRALGEWETIRRTRGDA